MAETRCFSTGAVVGGNKWAREPVCMCRNCEDYRVATQPPQEYLALHVRIPLPLRSSREDAERTLALIQGMANTLAAAIQATWAERSDPGPEGA